MTERKQINFTIVPDETGDAPRIYANFCAIAHTPFDFTLTFCEVLPPSEEAVKKVETDHVRTRPRARPDCRADAVCSKPDNRAARAPPRVRRGHTEDRTQGKPAPGSQERSCALTVPRESRARVSWRGRNGFNSDTQPLAPNRSRVVVRRLLSRLQRQQSLAAFTELVFKNPYELLVATILSAQCTDERVNAVTPALFTRYPDATTLGRAKPGRTRAARQTNGVLQVKVPVVDRMMASAVVDRHAEAVPARMDDLVRLPGRWTKDGECCPGARVRYSWTPGGPPRPSGRWSAWNGARRWTQCRSNVNSANCCRVTPGRSARIP